MLRNILIQVKRLTKILNWPRYAGPLITLALIAANQTLIVYGVFPVQVAWLYLPAAFAALIGLRAGLTSAGLVAAYSIWLNPTDPQRALIVPLSVLALAAGVGLQSRALRAALADAQAARSLAEAALADARAAHVETGAAWAREREARLKAEEGEEAIKALDGLNGNIERILRARNKVRDMANLAELSDTIRVEMGAILHTLNNVLTAVQGWQEYARLRERMGKEKIG